jgi:LysR family glycine cleavage system transcriptional activator
MLHLFGESVAPVCAPGFRDCHGLKGDLGNLAEVPLLHLSSRSQAWPEWFGLAGLHRSSVREGRYFDQHSMVIAAAIASLGVALVPLQMIGRELQGGDLVRLDGPVLTTGQSYYLVRPAGSRPDPGRAFEDWVREQVAKA